MVIKWHPFEVPVVSIPMTNEEFGEFKYHPTPTIFLSDQITGHVRSSTLLHEVIEMISEMHDLGLTESQIRTLEISLTQIMAQNPGLLTDTPS